jgi:hypothetical protein
VSISSATQVAGTQLFIGPDSGKSSVSQQAGRVYRATDTQVEYYSNGTNWVKFGVGSTQEPVPGVSTKELDNLFYAAKFSGADGGAQIQNAVNQANSTAGENAVIIGPVGPDSPSSAPETDVWGVSSTIDLTNTDNTQLIGRGFPLLYLKDAAEVDILRAGQDTTSNITENVRIEGLRLHGNRGNNSGAKKDPDGDGNIEYKGQVGIRPIKCSDWVVSDCHFVNFQRFGYCCKLAQGPMKVEDSTATNSGDDGFTVTNQYFQTKDVDDARHNFCNIEANNCDDQGIEIEDGAQNVTVRDSKFTNNANSGATVKSHIDNASVTGLVDEEACNNVTFVNCDSLNNTNKGFSAGGGNLSTTSDISFIDCYVEGNTDAGLQFGRIEDVEVKSLTSERNSTSSNAFAVSLGDGVRNADISGHFLLDDENAAVGARGGGVITDVNIDIHVDVATGSAMNACVRMYNSGFAGISVDGHLDGNGQGIGVDFDSGDGTIQDVTLEDSLVVENMDTLGVRIKATNNPISDFTIGGTYKNNGQNGGSTFFESGILLQQSGDTITDMIFDGVRAYDDQATKTQQFGIVREGDFHIYDNCNLRGNSNSAFGATAGANSVLGDNIT